MTVAMLSFTSLSMSPWQQHGARALAATLVARKRARESVRDR
jgi:hypothetical protein